MQDQIFITGATGCIGHYVLDELKQVFPNAHYHLFARRPERFKNNAPDWDNTTVYPFELNEMESSFIYTYPLLISVLRLNVTLILALFSP